MKTLRKNVVTQTYVVSVDFVDHIEETEVSAESQTVANTRAKEIVKKYGGKLLHVRVKKEDS